MTPTNISALVPLDEGSDGNCAEGICFVPDATTETRSSAAVEKGTSLSTALGKAPPPKCETTMERFDPCA
jgi:hypothetical protein